MSLGRSGPIKRSKGLNRATPKAKEWQQRSRKPMERTPMKTTPSKRKKSALSAMAKARPMVEARSHGMCEVRIPGVCEGRATNMHHRLPEGQGGASEPWNLLHLCGSGTTGCHGHIEHNREEAYTMGWLVRSGQDPREVHWMPAGGL